MALGLLTAGVMPLFWTALALAITNTLLRPLLVVIALPFNIITLGLASVFANLLTLVIAFAIAGVSSSFWPMLLIAFLVMLVDDGVRLLRQSLKKQPV